MFAWFEQQLNTVTEAIGVKRFAIGGLASMGPWVLNWIADNWGYKWFAVPDFIAGLIVVLFFLFFWTLTYATKLRLSLIPRISFVDPIASYEDSNKTGRITIRTLNFSDTDNVSVRLIDFREVDGTRHVKVDHFLLDERSGKAEISMHHGDTRSFQVARVDNKRIILGPFLNSENRELPFWPARLKIRINARSMKTVFRFYRVGLRNDGSLFIEPE